MARKIWLCATVAFAAIAVLSCQKPESEAAKTKEGSAEESIIYPSMFTHGAPAPLVYYEIDVEAYDPKFGAMRDILLRQFPEYEPDKGFFSEIDGRWQAPPEMNRAKPDAPLWNVASKGFEEPPPVTQDVLHNIVEGLTENRPDSNGASLLKLAEWFREFRKEDSLPPAWVMEELTRLPKSLEVGRTVFYGSDFRFLPREVLDRVTFDQCMLVGCSFWLANEAQAVFRSCYLLSTEIGGDVTKPGRVEMSHCLVKDCRLGMSVAEFYMHQTLMVGGEYIPAEGREDVPVVEDMCVYWETDLSKASYSSKSANGGSAIYYGCRLPVLNISPYDLPAKTRAELESIGIEVP